MHHPGQGLRVMNNSVRLEPEVVRLAETCGLTPPAVHALLVQARGSVAAARLMHRDEVWAALDLSAAGAAESAPDLAIWLPVQMQTKSGASAKQGQFSGSTLSVRYIGEGLPVLVLALVAEPETMAVAIPMWDAHARAWLHGIVSPQRFSLVIEPFDGGRPTFLTGQVQLPRSAVKELFEFEFSVDGPDRGHALRAAAVMAMVAANRRECHGPRADQRLAVGVVTGSLADLFALDELQRLVGSP